MNSHIQKFIKYKNKNIFLIGGNISEFIEKIDTFVNSEQTVLNLGAIPNDLVENIIQYANKNDLHNKKILIAGFSNDNIIVLSKSPIDDNNELLIQLRHNQFDLHYEILENLFKNTVKAFSERSEISWGTVPKNVFYMMRDIKLPVLEIGSGAGFISKGLKILGCNVIATDLLQRETYEKYFTNIEQLEMNDALKKYGTTDNYIFLIVWPRMHIDIETFESNELPLPKYIVWCGEPPGGCTGDIGNELLEQYSLRGSFRGTLNDKIYMNEITVVLEKGGQTSWDEIYKMAEPKKYY
jgi:hypothetical protein